MNGGLGSWMLHGSSLRVPTGFIASSFIVHRSSFIVHRSSFIVDGAIPMKQQDKQLAANFARRVRQRFPEARIWVFGSRARGDADPESDLDCLIVLDRVDRPTDRIIRDIAWEVGLEHGVVITTVVLDADQFQHGPASESTLVANVLKEGVPA
ncbi:MAG: hypothetical protein KatS3mg109_0264 [Pirellulaceae bacterium]|nr:MAG: hypothetical protein KatS3mg109_0264 [Pirellulaceae bacterium]